MEMIVKENLIDKAIKLDRELKLKKKELDEIKAMLQSEGLAELENKNLKYMQMFGDEGSCDISYKQKLEIENISLLKEIFGEVLDNKVTKKEEIKYDVESKFKSALIALYTGDYKEHNIDDILSGLGLDDSKRKLAMKKLKGEYITDKKVLESLGAIDEDGLEEELDAIREHKNYVNILRYINVGMFDNEEIKEKLKRAIFVEDSLALGLSYEK